MDLFGTKRRLVRETADRIEQSCSWILPALFESTLDQFVQMARFNGAVDAYIDKEIYGFFLNDREFTYHVNYEKLRHGLLIECNGDFYGAVICGHKDQPIDISLIDPIAPRGRLAKDLKAELLRRTGFHSIEDLTKRRGL